MFNIYSFFADSIMFDDRTHLHSRLEASTPIHVRDGLHIPYLK
jgi:hypothetical protein